MCLTADMTLHLCKGSAGWICMTGIGSKTSAVSITKPSLCRLMLIGSELACLGCFATKLMEIKSRMKIQLQWGCPSAEG